jgi:hypothetical protein
LKDDTTLANDPRRNNNFNYTHPGTDFLSNQENCPFSAHVRKTRPRADLGSTENVPNHIIRAGIPYGPEGMQSSLVQCSESVSDLTSDAVSDDEHTSGTSSSDPSQERGLAFGRSLVSIMLYGSADYRYSCIPISNWQRIPLLATHLGQQCQVITLSCRVISLVLNLFQLYLRQE